MNFLSNRYLAKMLWLAPLLMAAIAVGLTFTGFDQRETAEFGVGVDAEVLDVEVRERSEITHGMVKLRYTPPEANEPVERYVELPLAFMKDIQANYEADSSLVLPIRIQPGSDQIILDAFSRVQWVMTFSFAGMAAMGALGLVWLVGGWNRFLAREGDPGEREWSDEAIVTS